MRKRVTAPPPIHLRTARRIKGLTQAQLAAKAGVDKSLICLFESGKRDWRHADYRVLVHIARALNLAPDELFPVDALDAAETVS